MINVIQVGAGALGRQVLQFLHNREGIHVCGVVDMNSDLIGSDIGSLINAPSAGINVSPSIHKAMEHCDAEPDIAVLTTVSSIKKLIPQVEAAAKAGLHIVSTCEELTFPWKQHPDAAKEIDDICREYGVASLGTGVNPGFLMDYLPSVFTSIAQHVESIHVDRVQDASVRRIPFQQKIGAGLTHEAFESKKLDGSLRHVGLPESVDLIAHAMNWNLEDNRETLVPVLAKENISSGYKEIQKGDPCGVEQIGSGFMNGKEVIRLRFRAAVGEEKSYDRISIKGTPSVTTEIEGGLNGDTATCAITVNAIRSVTRCTPGLKTMLDVPVPSFYSKA
jgi:4-hydroxy-tetrahydrodipicolinate reductase